MKHYTCTVDLVGHVGNVNEAKEFINSMLIKFDVTIWTYFLGAYIISNKMGYVHSWVTLTLDQKIYT